MEEKDYLRFVFIERDQSWHIPVVIVVIVIPICVFFGGLLVIGEQVVDGV